MNEMIPKPNTVPAEKDPKQFSMEKLAETLQVELQKAADYVEVMDVLTAAVEKNGHQAVEDAWLAVYVREPNSDNKYYLRLIVDMAENTLSNHESLKEPDREAVGRLHEFVNSYTEEEIRRVADITNPEEALVNPERLRMRDACSPFYKLARELRYDSAADLDVDHSKYPEFWRIYEKFIAIYQAVGSVNTSLGTVNHSRIVKR